MLDRTIASIIEKHSGLSLQEKISLQEVFQDPEIQEQLLYREKKRRRKILWSIYGVLCILVLMAILIWWGGNGNTWTEKGSTFFSALEKVIISSGNLI